VYSVVLDPTVLHGIDDVKPLLEYKASCPVNDRNVNKNIDAALDLKQVVVSYFALSILLEMIRDSLLDPSARDIRLSKADLMHRARLKYGVDKVGPIMVESLFNLADEDNTGYIDHDNIQWLCKKAAFEVKYHAESDDEYLSPQEVVTAVAQFQRSNPSIKEEEIRGKVDSAMFTSPTKLLKRGDLRNVKNSFYKKDPPEGMTLFPTSP
jgi:hypothetical protein